MGKSRRLIDAPVMSDVTILVSVEDLINNAMGRSDINTVNFKIIQSVLLILARQLRLLETQVDFRVSDSSDTPDTDKKKRKKKATGDSPPTTPKSDITTQDITEGPVTKQSEGKKGKVKSVSGKTKAEKEEAGKEKETDDTAAGKKGKEDATAAGKKGKEDATAAGKTGKEDATAAGKTGKEDATGENKRKQEALTKKKEKKEAALQTMTAGPEEREEYVKEKKEDEFAESSIAISEVERENKKVLVVEKGPKRSPGPRPRVGSIEVVTHSEFAMVEAMVNELKEKAGPLPMPSLPDNEKLRSDLAKGSASLTDTMQAMQVSARVMAAEKGLSRMAELLTQLAAAGALPPELAMQLKEVTTEMEALKGEFKEQVEEQETRSTAGRPQRPSSVPRKSVAIDPLSSTYQELEDGRPSSVERGEGLKGRISTGAISTTSRMSRASTVPRLITQIEMNEAIESTKADLLNKIRSMTEKATTSVASAVETSTGVAGKLDIAMKLNSRITELHDLMSIYKDQLSGFDAGLTTQMTNFQEQMAQMRGDLLTGLKQFEAANTNAETAAVMELTERYEGLVVDLEETATNHQHISSFQNQLGDELNSLVQAVEMMREQKADRDEVVDGLRDKADSSRLAGLLTEKEFARSRVELDARLDWCYDKFNKQEHVWMEALKDLSAVVDGKAEIMQLLAARDEAQEALRDIEEKLRALAIQLGEPKAALLTRLLSKDGKCGSCMVPALMEALDKSYGKPPALVAFHPPPDEEPCVPQMPVEPQEDEKVHKCKRWVGGSHTLMSSAVPSEVAPASLLAHSVPVKKYTGYGADGKLYHLEDKLVPCVECNKLYAETERLDDVYPCVGDSGDTALCHCTSIAEIQNQGK